MEDEIQRIELIEWLTAKLAEVVAEAKWEQARVVVAWLDEKIRDHTGGYRNR